MSDPQALIVSLPAFEGPLALLLELARAERIDLTRISMLALAEQYIAFVEQVPRLELAADHLVMAAWLAYLKSALLLPPEEQPDPDPRQLAEELRWRLRRLQAMREASEKLWRRPMAGRDVVMRGMAEGLRSLTERRIDASLHDLLRAYAACRRPVRPHWRPHGRRDILGIEDALARLQKLIGGAAEWRELQQLLPRPGNPRQAASNLASTLVAALELTRQGVTELAQPAGFGPVRLRARVAGPNQRQHLEHRASDL